MTNNIPQGFPVVRINPKTYLLACVKCGVARPLLWGGPAAYQRARTAMCRACHGRTTVTLQQAYEPDPLVVDLLVDGGYRMKAMKSERMLALEKLQRRHPDWQGWRLADRLKVSVRTVDRYRKEMRQQSEAA